MPIDAVAASDYDPDETWSKPRLDQLKAMLEKGACMSTLKRQLSSSSRAIEARIARYNLPSPKAPPKRLSSWTPDELSELQAMRESGVDSATIQEHFGISKGNLGNVVKRYDLRRLQVYGSDRKAAREPLSWADKDQLKGLWEEGVRTSLIAETFNLSESAVRDNAKKLDAERPEWFVGQGWREDVHEWTEMELEHLKTLAKMGYCSEDIAEALGLTRDQVWYRCKVRGIKLLDPVEHSKRAAAARMSDRVDMTLRLRRAGLETDEIAERVGVKQAQVGRYLKLLEARGISFPSLRYSCGPWRPTSDELATLRQGYRLGVRPETIADVTTANTGRQICRVAREEEIRHPYFRKPHLQALRPEVLLHHIMEGTLEKHLDDVLLCYRVVSVQDITRALERYETARIRFPEIKPWPHPQIAPRATKYRAVFQRAADKEAWHNRRVMRELKAAGIDFLRIAA